VQASCSSRSRHLYTRQRISVFYNASLTPSNFSFVSGPLPVDADVTFDTTTAFAFAPSTTVSRELLRAEPQTTLERQVGGSLSDRVDPNRIFIDWPLSSSTHRPAFPGRFDGGDSSACLYDRAWRAAQPSELPDRRRGDTETR